MYIKVYQIEFNARKITFEKFQPLKTTAIWYMFPFSNIFCGCNSKENCHTQLIFEACRAGSRISGKGVHI